MDIYFDISHKTKFSSNEPFSGLQIQCKAIKILPLCNAIEISVKGKQ